MNKNLIHSSQLKINLILFKQTYLHLYVKIQNQNSSWSKEILMIFK